MKSERLESMIRNREEFIKALWEDYRNFSEENREESFIYNYFKRKKDMKAQQIARDKNSLNEYQLKMKRDKYIQLKSAYLAYLDEVLTEEEYMERYEYLTKALMDSPYICGICYTQLYDIEQEQNGFFTYERAPKLSQEAMEQIAACNRLTAQIEK